MVLDSKKNLYGNLKVGENFTRTVDGVTSLSYGSQVTIAYLEH